MAIRYRILIADDHKLVAELFQGYLASDFDVVGVRSQTQHVERRLAVAQ